MREAGARRVRPRLWGITESTAPEPYQWPGTSNLQTDVSAEMPGHHEVMPIDRNRRGRRLTAAKRIARAAAALYLLMVVLAGITQLGARAGIRVPGDASTAAQNIAANPTLFRVSLVTDIATATI